MANISLAPLYSRLPDEPRRAACDALEGWMRLQPDATAFYRMNPALLAAEFGCGRTVLLDVFLAGVPAGLFDLRWDYHCPHCNGLPGFASHLSEMRGADFCGLCNVEFRNTLDANVEVTFSTAPNFVAVPEAHVKAETERMLAAVMAKSYRMPEDFISGMDCLHSAFFHAHFTDDVLSADESLEIRSTCLLFTDIRGSTALYERIGDARAYQFVREHFKILFRMVETHGGIVVKTIGDAVMAGFQRPADALTAAFAMHEETRRLTVPGTEGAIEIKYGLHTGPAIAVNLNERVDYFGQTVNMAARIQSIAKKNEICFSSAVFEDERTRSYLEMLRPAGLRRMRVRLKGIEAEQVVYAWAGG